MKKNPVDPSPNDVHFIQFLFPDGRRQDQWVERTEEIARRAAALWAKGFSLEIENKDGLIWMTCVKHSEDLAVDRMCMNGPEVLVKVDELINKAYDWFILGQP